MTAPIPPPARLGARVAVLPLPAGPRFPFLTPDTRALAPHLGAPSATAAVLIVAASMDASVVAKQRIATRGEQFHAQRERENA